MVDGLASRSARDRLLSGESALWIAFTLIAVGALLRLHHLDKYGLWADELSSASTAWIERAPDAPLFEVKQWTETRIGDSFWTQIAADVSPPLYKIILKVWLTAFGPSELSVRFPGFLASVLWLPALFLGLRRLSGVPAALFALATTALNPGLIFYAKDARYYSFLVLFSGLSALGAMTYWETSARSSKARLRWGQVGPLILLSMTHYFGIVLAATLAGGYTVSAFHRRDRSAIPKLGVLLAVNVAWLAVNLGGLRWGSSGANRWADYTWPDLFVTLIPIGFELAFPYAVGFLYLAALAGAALLARDRIWGDPISDAGEPPLLPSVSIRTVGIVLASYVLVLLFIGAFSVRSGAFNPRYTLHVFVILHIAGALALARLPGNSTIKLFGVLAIAVFGVASGPAGPRPQPQEYREASHYIANDLRDSDIVVGAIPNQLGYYYFYLHQMVPDERYVLRGYGTGEEMRNLCDELAGDESSAGRSVYVFYPERDTGLSDNFLDACGERYRLAVRRLFLGVSVDRFDPFLGTSRTASVFCGDFESGSLEGWKESHPRVAIR